MYFHLPYARRIVYQRSEFKVEALPRQLPIIEISAFEERVPAFLDAFPGRCRVLQLFCALFFFLSCPLYFFPGFLGFFYSLLC